METRNARLTSLPRAQVRKLHTNRTVLRSFFVVITKKIKERRVEKSEGAGGEEGTKGSSQSWRKVAELISGHEWKRSFPENNARTRGSWLSGKCWLLPRSRLLLLSYYIRLSLPPPFTLSIFDFVSSGRCVTLCAYACVMGHHASSVPPALKHSLSRGAHKPVSFFSHTRDP